MNHDQPAERELPKMDWVQVSLNGGPPCFAVGIDEPNRYCGRAERWEGHGHHHEYISLEALLAESQAERYRQALEHYADEKNWDHHSSGVDGDSKRQYKAVCYNGAADGYHIAQQVLKETR